MTSHRLREPRLPGLSLDLELPRWLPRAIRIGLGLALGFFLVIAIVGSTRSPGDRSWSSPVLHVQEALQIGDGEWQYRVLVTAGTETAGLADGWSVLLSSGGVAGASSSAAGELEPGASAEAIVRVRYGASPWPGEPVALRWDPGGRLGTMHPLNRQR